jgi:hypothetical protein
MRRSAYWWHSSEVVPEDVTPAQLNYELNSDYEPALLSATEIQALVAAWQAGAISRDTLLHNLRQVEVLPSARTNEQIDSEAFMIYDCWQGCVFEIINGKS